MSRLKKINIDYIPRYTYKDYMQWEGRWELIDGVAYAMSPQPSIKHQHVSGKIHTQLSEALKECIGCLALLPVDWKINENTVVQPDNLVTCRKEEGDFLSSPPEIIYEILSPSTAFKDKNIKYKIYESEGVKYYVIVDIDAKVAEVFELIDGNYTKIKNAQDVVVTFDIGKCKIDFDFAKIW